MKKNMSSHPPMYGISKFRVYAILLLFTLMMKAALSLGSPLPSGKPKAQIEEEFETLISTYLLLDVIIETGSNLYTKDRETVKLALMDYFRHMAPVMLKGNFHQSMRKNMFPQFLDVYIQNPIVMDSFFARALVVAEKLKTIDVNNAYEEFRVPEDELIDKTVHILNANGFEIEQAIDAMKKYRAKFINRKL